MLIHRGEIILKKLKERGMPITVFCDRLKISRSTAYNWFEREDLPIEYVIRCSKILDYDFLQDFELGLKSTENVVSEPEIPYGNWKDKYYKLLEQNWDLQVKFNKLLETKLIEYATELNPNAT